MTLKQSSLILEFIFGSRQINKLYVANYFHFLGLKMESISLLGKIFAESGFSTLNVVFVPL